MGTLNYAIIFSAVVFLGLFGGTLYALLRRAALRVDIVEGGTSQLDRIVELAAQVEDRDDFIDTLTLWAGTVTDQHPDVTPPEVPEWWRGDGGH